MGEIHLRHFPAQRAFYACQDFQAALVGGLGYGKTRAASDWTLTNCARWPKARHFMFSNTFPQLMSGTLESFFEACARWGVRYIDRVRTSKTVRLPDLGARIEVWTADEPELFRSLEIDLAWVDEAHKWSRKAYETLLGRCRGSDHSRSLYPDLKLALRLTANPPHTTDHWLVESCTVPNEKTGKPPITLFVGSTFENYLLPETYVDTLVSQYDPELANIELGGNFGDIGRGRIWRRFQRNKHVLTPARAIELGLPPLEWEPRLPVGWSHDFNVDPMCSVLFQWRKIDVAGYQRIVMYVLDEIRVRDAVIDQVFKEFLNRDAAKVARRSGLVLYGDASGEARNRQTGFSDWAALRKLLAQAGYVGEARVPNTNPMTRDRFNAGNAKLENAKNHIGVVFRDDKCRYLVKDISQTFYKPGTSDQLVVKVEDGGTTTHLGDAWSYAIAEDFPIEDVARPPAAFVR